MFQFGLFGDNRGCVFECGNFGCRTFLFYRKKERIIKKALSLILALVLCLSLCACGGGKANETPNETTTTPTEEVAKSKVGDTVSTDIAELVLSNISYEEAFNQVVPKDGYSFVVVDFSLKNIGKTDFGFFPSHNGGKSKLPYSIVWVDYNDGYTFAADDVVGKDGKTYDVSCFGFPHNDLISDLKPLSDAAAYQVAICVPNEVIDNTAAPLLIKINLLNAAGETVTAIYSVR